MRAIRGKDTRISPWKPWSLRPPFLGLIACFSIGSLVSIEILRRISGRNNGLAFYSTTDEISTGMFVAYNYIPTILATVFSILWSIVDLDTKRMEPYTQISDSRRRPFPLALRFLDYAFGPPWEVPFQACKNHHWTVAITSTMFLIISMFLAPIQSALFGLTPINKSYAVAVDAWPDLPSIADQSKFFTGETVDQALSVILNNTTLPPFTTEDYAISPLRGLTGQGGQRRNVEFASSCLLVQLGMS